MKIRALVPLLAASVLGACGGGSGPSSESHGDFPAPHPPMPHVVSLGGPVTTAPKIVEITFQGDPLQAEIDTFMEQLAGATEYWKGATAEYGVGPLVAVTSVTLAEKPAAELADTDVQVWLKEKILAAQVPPADENTIYLIYYPSSTVVTMGGGSLCGMTGANDFQGYHDDFAISPGKYVTYGIAGRCPSPVPNLPEIDELSAEASHELIEAATDPLPTDNPAYISLDPDHLAWELLSGPEVADMCAANPDAFYDAPGLTTLVQRVWSNAAAAAGHDPCEPDGTTPYFNSAPVMTDTVQIPNTVFGPLETQGVDIPIGTSKTIDVDLYSDAPTSGPWTVSALDLSSIFFGAANPALSFSFDKTTGQNGDTLHLTITALAAGPLGASPFWIESDLGQTSKFWAGVVGN